MNALCFLILCRHLLEHLGFQDIMPKADGADGAGEDASLAAHADALQLTSPRSAPGTSPPQHMPEANGNAFKEEGTHAHSSSATINTHICKHEWRLILRFTVAFKLHACCIQIDLSVMQQAQLCKWIFRTQGHMRASQAH